VPDVRQLLLLQQLAPGEAMLTLPVKPASISCLKYDYMGREPKLSGSHPVMMVNGARENRDTGQPDWLPPEHSGAIKQTFHDISWTPISTQGHHDPHGLAAYDGQKQVSIQKTSYSLCHYGNDDLGHSICQFES
jgi:hypothetical protein